MTQAEYESLAREIQAHDRRYYVENNSTIEDIEYDKLFAQLRAVEAEHPDWIVDWSPSKRVGSDLTSTFPKIERKLPMLLARQHLRRERAERVSRARGQGSRR